MAENTVLKLISELDAAYSRHQDETIRGVRSKRVHQGGASTRHSTPRTVVVGIHEGHSQRGVDSALLRLEVVRPRSFSTHTSPHPIRRTLASEHAVGSRPE